MSGKDKIECPSCGSETEFIKTCVDCGHVFCPWCLVHHVDPYRVAVPRDIHCAAQDAAVTNPASERNKAYDPAII